MSSQRVPNLTLPTSDYDRMLSMSNRHLICVLRSAVLSPDNIRRFSPRPPEEHDAYTITHRPGCIDVHLRFEGEDVFCCKFVPASEY